MKIEKVIIVLGNLNIGERGRIIDLSGVNDLVRRRLMDFGIAEGSEVCMKSKMAFKGPVIIECRGQCIGLRHMEASFIKVEVL